MTLTQKSRYSDPHMRRVYDELHTLSICSFCVRNLHVVASETQKMSVHVTGWETLKLPGLKPGYFSG
jgi:hypothetical protein